MYDGPLNGLNVVEFGHYFAAPMAGMLLAEQGANVVRIVRPGAPELPDEQYRLLNRNKKLLTLDLKSEEGRQTALSLIARCDVVIENFRPGVMGRLGLDYAAMRESNPGLVYLSLPGFSSTDESRAHIQAWEGVLGAAVGLYTDTHWMRQRLRYPPLYSWVPHCSAYGAMQGSIAVMAALVSRQVHGAGTVIEAPLVDAGLTGFAFNAISVGKDVALTALFPALEPYEFSADDDEATQLDKLEGATWGSTSYAGRVFDCADGRKIFIWDTDSYLASGLLKTLGLYQRVLREGLVDTGMWDPEQANDNLACSYLLRPELKDKLVALISEVIRTKSAKEWEDIINDAGLLAAVVRSRDEYLELESMHASGVLTKMGTGAEELTVPGRIVDASGADGALMKGFHEPEHVGPEAAAALLGDRPAPSSPSCPPASLSKGDLLRGIRVLDLANVLAAPLAAHALAEYGADVIKAAPKEYLFPGTLTLTMAMNQGKRSILVDPGTEPGRRVLNKLVSWADLVVHNILDDTAKRMGVTHEQLQRINPEVVTCGLSAFGGTWRGGWEGRRAFDPVACMATGMMVQYGTLAQPQPHGSTSCGDVMGGLCAAFAALLGLYQKRATGIAGEVRVSLVRANNYIQLPYVIGKNGSSDWGEPHGQFVKGENGHHRLYECADGWIFVGARADQAGFLSQEIAGRADADEQALEASFRAASCADWLARLDAVNIAAHPVLSVSDLRAHVRHVSNAAVDEAGGDNDHVLCWEHHPCGRPITLMNPKYVRIGDRRTYRRLAPAPRFGQHSREILKEVGYSEVEVSELVRIGAVYTYLTQLSGEDDYFFEPVKVKAKLDSRL